MSNVPLFPYGEESLEQGRDLIGRVCANPSIDALRTLTDREVGLLTWTIFTQVGYHVEAVKRDTTSFDFLLHPEPSAGGQGTILIETKHYTKAMVAVAMVEQFIAFVGAQHEAQGYFLTTGEFSLAAYARAQSEPNIVLLNGERLLRLACIASLSATAVGHNNPVERLRLAEAINKVLPTQMKVVTIASIKGGTGKTTSTVQLARSFASFGQSVLVVDMDTQRNASSQLGQRTAASMQPTSGALRYFSPIIASKYQGIDLVQAPDVVSLPPPWADIDLVRELHEGMLSQHQYDWVLIDTSPDLGVTTRAALASSHYVVTPVGPWQSDITGFNHLQTAIFMERAIMGEGVILLGAILTRYTDRGAEKKHYVELQEQLQQHQVNVLGGVSEHDFHHEPLLLAAYQRIAQRIISLTD